jgi:predicted PurR-regulated permease PerM
MLKEGTSKYFFIGMIAIAAIVSTLIIFPFLTSIITGGILAFVFYPLYRWMQKRIAYRGLAAFITAVVILLIVTVPVVMLFNTMTKETHYLYLRTKQQLTAGKLIESRCYENTFLCRTINNVNNLLRDESIKNYLVGLLNDVLTFFTKKISNLIFSLPSVILHLLVVLFTCYYVLKDGKDVIKRIEKVAPLKVHHQEQIIQQFGDVTRAIIYGTFLVALIQGALGAFGFWLFGINSFIWWGIIMTFFAVIPFIGTWVVWFPASLFLGITGYLQGETGLIWRGVGLFFFGLLIISTIDNILKPIIVAERAKVHPLLILIGILGGLFVFGFIGIILGPMVLALLQTLLAIYEREKMPHLDEPQPDILGHKNHVKGHGRK